MVRTALAKLGRIDEYRFVVHTHVACTRTGLGGRVVAVTPSRARSDGGYRSVLAFAAWSDLSGDPTSWAGVPAVCAAIVGAFSLVSGVGGWILWTRVTFVLLLVGWLGAHHHAARAPR